MNETQRAEMQSINWWHRIRMPNGEFTAGQVMHGPDGGDWPTTRFGMPLDLTGKTVLDSGAWDGFFSFEAERRGARFVVASDTSQSEGGNWGANKGFRFAHKMLNSKVEWQQMNIEDKRQVDALKNATLTPSFDLVMSFGVLYHLKSPLLGMENLMSLVKPNGGTLLIETAIAQRNDSAALEYRPHFAGDPTNYFYPNLRWISAAAEQYAAKTTEVIYITPHRATVRITK